MHGKMYFRMRTQPALCDEPVYGDVGLFNSTHRQRLAPADGVEEWSACIWLIDGVVQLDQHSITAVIWSTPASHASN